MRTEAATGSRVVVIAGGDVRVERDPATAERLFAPTTSIRKEADILFANCENAYSDRKIFNEGNFRRGFLCPAANLDALKDAGFDVMSFTNNHHLDYGYETFFDTISALRTRGIAPVGVGKDITEARRPVVVERNGVRVAFLAYACVFIPDTEADVGKPGGAVVRTYTYYHQIEKGQTGTDPKILTFADPDDLDALKEDLKVAGGMADVVMVAFHWGIHYVPVKIAHYEKQIGRFAIDSGADAVLGCHQHVLKGVEVYKGKPIFYGMNEFVMDHEHNRELAKGKAALNPDRLYNKAKYGRKMLQPDGHLRIPEARKTIIVKAVILDQEVVRVSYYPCLIDIEDAPHPLKAGTAEFVEHLDYMRAISRAENLPVSFEPDGDEVVVLTADVVGERRTGPEIARAQPVSSR